MRKIFLIATLILTMWTATAFAAEKEPESKSSTETTATETQNEPYEYTSETYGFKITCPSKPVVVVKPFEDPNKNGELLVFANEGIKVLFGYIVELDAFDDKQVPNFNRDKKNILDAYVAKKRNENIYNFVEIQNITNDNKALVMVTEKELEILDDKGKVQGKMVADQQTVYVHFRSKSGRCISIQLVDVDLDESDFKDFLKSVATYKDATDLSMPENFKDSKSKDKKDKKSKDKKEKKEKKDKKDKK